LWTKIKIVVTDCHILRLKYFTKIKCFTVSEHQNRFLLGLSLRPRWGSLQCSPYPIAGFKGVLLLSEGKAERGGKGPTSKGEKGREGREGEGKKGREGA